MRYQTQNTRRETRMLLCVVLAALMAGCSTTSRIPDGEVLYTGLKGVKIEDDKAFPSDLHEVLTEAVDVPGNKKQLYLFPLGLWIYNHWDEPSDSSKSIKSKIYRKFVEEPVLVSEVRPNLRVKLLDEILDNNGYFRGTTSYRLVSPKNNDKKASIEYVINPGKPFTIDSIAYIADTTQLVSMIDSLAQRDRYLQRGSVFSMDSLDQVRTRITNRLHNRGYYFFRPEYIQYLCDSTLNPGHIALKLDLASNTPDWASKQYVVGDITMYVYRSRGGGTPDTSMVNGVRLIQMMPSRLRHQIVQDNVTFRKGRPFAVRNLNNTQTYLSRLGIFSNVNVEAIPDTTAAVPTLDVIIGATFDTPLEVALEVNASSKSNSYIGPGLSFTVTNHNVFGGGEQLSVGLTGSYEWQTGSGSRSIFNSYELGINSTLAFPRLLAPKFIPRRRRQLSWTRIGLSGELLNRPHFFKLAQLNTNLTYDWQSSRTVSNSLTLFKLSYNKLINTTAEFDSIIAANPAVGLSFQSQFIPQMMYSMTFNKLLNRDNTLNWQFTVQEAGNLFWAAYDLCGAKGEKRLFGTPFSQFVKGQTQLVWGHRLVGDQWLMSRVAVGAAHAYGNSTQVPYSEQFYCGGANSVRAFTVRSIGPGSYHVPGTKSDYFDQTGTFKFEANVEYRFPIYGPLNGAVFVDAGNVWLLKDDPMRPGGTLRGSTFFKDLALGTGCGLRFDIGMLVLRGDLGIGIHAPYDTGKRGYYNMTSFGSSLAFHLAIGYPF